MSQGVIQKPISPVASRKRSSWALPGYSAEDKFQTKRGGTFQQMAPIHDKLITGSSLGGCRVSGVGCVHPFACLRRGSGRRRQRV